MMAHRTTPAAPGLDRDAAILDAARACVIRNGVRKTTAQDIADQAGISRMTFYRAMGSVDSAVLAALTREFEQKIAEILGELSGDARTRLSGFCGRVIGAFDTSEFIASIRERDPELLTPYLSNRLGHSQEIVLRAIQMLLAEGVRDGSIGDAPGRALMILLSVQGVALGTRSLRDDSTRDLVIREFTAMIHSSLNPLSTLEHS